MRGVVFAVLLLAGCGAGEGQLRLKDGASLETSAACGGDAGTCQTDQFCAVVDYASGAVGPACLSFKVCELMTCGEVQHCRIEFLDAASAASFPQIYKVDCVYD